MNFNVNICWNETASTRQWRVCSLPAAGRWMHIFHSTKTNNTVVNIWNLSYSRFFTWQPNVKIHWKLPNFTCITKKIYKLQGRRFNYACGDYLYFFHVLIAKFCPSVICIADKPAHTIYLLHKTMCFISKKIWDYLIVVLKSTALSDLVLVIIMPVNALYHWRGNWRYGYR